MMKGKYDILKIKFYGSRGSIPFFSRTNIKYGGNTSCVRIDTCGHIIILDCGSGLLQLGTDMKNEGDTPERIDILISHLHLDHIIGLATFTPIFDRRSNSRIFTKSRDERPLAEQVFGAFKPPYWPIDLSKHNYAEMIEINGADSFMLNENIKVTPMLSRHPDDTTAFRIEAENRSLVYLLDYEIGETPESNLVKFCRSADLIIFDSAYLPEHYPEKRGWGHSHYNAGIRLAELSKCKNMVLSHFSFDYTDDVIDAAACRIEGGKYKFAYDGMEMEI